MAETLEEYLTRKRRCVCPPFADARDCYRRRYGLSMWGEDEWDDGRCECPCHDEDREDEDDDW
jgi:hypothetical protein